MSLRTPLSRARGLGSAKEGVHHWWMQRVTAIALVPLTLWFVVVLMSAARADYITAVAWISRPWNAALLILLLITGFYHAILGMQVVIEDYVHHEGLKLGSLLALRFILWLLGAVSVIAVLRIALVGG